MSEKKYRVIQWATGTVGKAALKYWIENPLIELVGVFVTNPDKATGIIATNDADALLAVDADCVFFAGLMEDLDLFERILESGKNLISPAGPFAPTERYKDKFDRIDAACQKGGTSYHGCGIHPGFSGDILPLTLTRLMNRIDCIEVSEIVDKLRNPMVYIEMMGFGRDPDELLANPSRSPEAPYAFQGSMNMVVESLGKTIDKLTTRLEVATATKDIPYPNGLIKKGTVGGQHFEWTAWCDGAPIMIYHFYWTMGEDLEPKWDNGDSKYRVVIKGDPPLECHLMGTKEAWTGLVGCTVLPLVCDAAPGILTHLDFGIVQPHGLVRR